MNDWTTTIQLGDVNFSVVGAKALLNISSSILPSPIRISNPSDLVTLVNPTTEDSNQIIFEASLDVVFPVFLIYQGIGIGSRIEYTDENLLDQTRSDPIVSVDILIEISEIQYAVEAIKNATEFLSDIAILNENIPIVQLSVNDLIAGEGRSLADMFDFTGMFDP